MLKGGVMTKLDALNPAQQSRMPAPRLPGKFTKGSIWRHVIIMAGTSSVGLIAVFFVDLLNFFYISLLGQKSMSAAIGFASVIGFFQISIAIGISIGMSVITGRMIGGGDREAARLMGSSALAVTFALMGTIAAGIVIFMPWLLSALGATGEARDYTASFLDISAISFPLLGLGIAGSSLLRAVGDARRAMYVTLGGAFSAAIFDPILILWLHEGVVGAAISSVIARGVLAAIALTSLIRVHNLLGPLEVKRLGREALQLFKIAAPAILTNLASPVGAAFITRAMAQFGPAAIAGQATIDRVSPVAFGLVYALSGAIGPILAQNLGAGLPERMRTTLNNSIIFVVIVVSLAWFILACLNAPIIAMFGVTGLGVPLVQAFCNWGAAGFIFLGLLFVANATFNNLGHPLIATAFNWGRATLGTIPLVSFGAHYGPVGILAGQAIGAMLFGTAACVMAIIVTRGRMRLVGNVIAGISS